MNAKHRELMDLQKKAQARLAKTRERFQDGMRDAREVREDLEWTEKKIKWVFDRRKHRRPAETIVTSNIGTKQLTNNQEP